jgi:hypothetical protein
MTTIISLFLLSCSSTPQGLNPNLKATGTGEKISGIINIAKTATYKYPETIENSVKAECTELTSKISTFTKSYAKEKGIKN